MRENPENFDFDLQSISLLASDFVVSAIVIYSIFTHISRSAESERMFDLDLDSETNAYFFIALFILLIANGLNSKIKEAVLRVIDEISKDRD